MINIYYKSIKEKKISVLDKFKIGSWVNVYSPDEDELKRVAKMLGADINLLKDALDPHEAPRLESEKGVIYMFTRAPQERDGEIKTASLLIVVGENYVLTVAQEKLDFFDSFIDNQHKINTTQKTKFFFEFFVAINQSYNRFLLDINRRMRSLHVNIKKISSQDIINFIDFERILNDFLAALFPTNAALEKMLGGRHMPLYEEDKDLIQDLFLANNQLAEYSKSILKYAVNIRNAYSSIMTHNLNRIMKILTALTIVLTAPTIIFSFYGMNVSLPIDSSPLAFLYISIVAVFISLGIFLIFMRNRWL